MDEMMAPGKKKDTAAMIIASMKPKEAVESADMDMQSEMDASSVAAEEVMSALSSGDAAGFKEAMKSFISMCMDEMSES